MTERKIRKEDVDPVNVIAALADGIPKAVIAGVVLYKHSMKVDPSLLDPLQLVYAVDNLQISGPRLSRLWSDVAKEDVVKFVAVILARKEELAGVDERTLNHAIDHLGDGIDFQKVLAALQIYRPQFNPAYKPASVP